MSEKRFHVAIAGATGAVGQEILSCLEQFRFPVGQLDLYAKANGTGHTLTFAGRDIVVGVLGEEGFGKADIVFLAVGAEVSPQLASMAVAGGAVVIDNSSAHRGDPAIPLVIPEVNGDRVDLGAKIFANPNCSTIIALMALGPLSRMSPVSRLIASTYQAVSGAGNAGLNELDRAQGALKAGATFSAQVFSTGIAENLIPWIGEAGANGSTDEEEKMGVESRKILECNNLRVSCTCVRVGVRRAHAISMHVEFENSVGRAEILEAWKSAPGLRVVSDHDAPKILNPKSVEGQGDVFCGRLRQVDEEGRVWAMFAVGDQVLKGAAQNAVQIAGLWAKGRPGA